MQPKMAGLDSNTKTSLPTRKECPCHTLSSMALLLGTLQGLQSQVRIQPVCTDELPATLFGEGTFPGRAAGPSPHSLQQRDNLKRTLLFALRTALLPGTFSYGLQLDGIMFWKAFRAGLSRASPSGTLVGSFVHLSAACRRCTPTEFGGLPPSAFLCSLQQQEGPRSLSHPLRGALRPGILICAACNGRGVFQTLGRAILPGHHMYPADTGKCQVSSCAICSSRNASPL